MRHLAGVVAIAAATSMGCGGGGGERGSVPTVTAPVAPTPTPLPEFAVVDGITHEPLMPDSVTPTDPQVGEPVTVLLAGFLTREQLWEGPRIELWPSRNGRDADAFETIVYAYGERPLFRWDASVVDAGMSLDREDWAEELPMMRDALGWAFDRVAAAGGPRFSLSPETTYGREPEGDPALKVIVHSGNQCLQGNRYLVACAQFWLNNGTITRAELIFESPKYASKRRAVMFALGYAIGLNPTALVGAVMNPNWARRGIEFHEMENLSLHMMYGHRAPGNLLPDRDPAVAGSGRSAGVKVQGDPGPDGGR